MKKRVLQILFVVWMSVLIVSCAGSRSLEQTNNSSVDELRSSIQAILADSAMRQSTAGIKIVSLDRDEILFEQNAEQLFHPASNMKLLTTAAALKKLRPEFRFKTVLIADTNSVVDSTLQGDLFIKGYGDPDLEITALQTLTNSLANMGIREIAGNIVCDASYLDDFHWGNGWMWDDVSAWYWAPISALSVNDNCIVVHVAPAETIGDSLLVRLEPTTEYFKLLNHAVTLDSTDTLARKEFKVEREWRPAANVMHVEGGLMQGERERRYTIDVVDAPLFVGTLLAETLPQRGISFSGNVVSGTVPDTHQVLTTHHSEPLTAAIINTNKISDNLSAELLLKVVGAESRGTPGTAAKGISTIYEVLDKMSVDSTSYHLADGSGVSRYNVVTSNLLISLLTDMHNDFTIQAEFKTSLPIAAVDGTLGRRMHDTRAAGTLRAKTGSLRGVSSLAGYTITADGEQLAFSILMEHFVVRTSRIRGLQDQIGALISGFSRNMSAGQ